jgi:hypothetical protein
MRRCALGAAGVRHGEDRTALNNRAAAAVVIAFAVGQLPLSATGLMLASGLSLRGSGYLLTLYDVFVAMGLSPSLERGVCALPPEAQSATGIHRRPDQGPVKK